MAHAGNNIYAAEVTAQIQRSTGEVEITVGSAYIRMYSTEAETLAEQLIKAAEIARTYEEAKAQAEAAQQAAA